MKGSMPIVNNTVVADAKQRLGKAMGIEPKESLLKAFSSASPELQEQFLTAMKATSDTFQKNVKSFTKHGNISLSEHSSDALNNLISQLTKAKELAGRIEKCEYSLREFEAKLQSTNESWNRERQSEEADLDELRKASDALHDKVPPSNPGKSLHDL